ncbi:hypothetical protein AAF712_003598 [Marasmius tenuissimus]|uniref:RRM domain-containing protein n=1 Tax=Marasmius tenuissimus TaxID=585030 RepID=A0ABR3A6T9_9AGAR
MSAADISKESLSLHGLLPPTNDDIEAVIQMATSGEGRAGPIKDTRTQLFVGNLPYRVRWQDLKDLFRKAGTVLRADVSLGPDNRSRGYGTVLLATAEDAGRAIDMFNGYSWQTRVLEVRPDRMGSDVDQQSHYEQMNQTNNMRASNTVLPVPSLFVGGGVAGAGGDLDYAGLLGLESRPTSSSGSSSVGGGGGGRNLFVGNLPFHCQWQDLKDLFRQAGTILRADVALGQDGRSRGFGTVVFATEADAERALRMFNGYEYNGRPLKVHYDKFSQSAQPTILPIQALSPTPALSTSLSTPASPTPHYQHQKLIPPHLSHLISTSHLGNSVLSSAITGRSSSSAPSPRHINSYPSSRPLSPHPPQLSTGLSVPQHQNQGGNPNQIVMPAGYTLDFGPNSQPTTPHYDGLPIGGYFAGSNPANSTSDWPPRSGAASAASSREGELTVSSLAERIIGKGLGGLSIGDAREATGLQKRPSLLDRSETGNSAPAGSYGGQDAMSRILTRRASVTNSAVSAASSSGSGSSSVIGSGSVSRTNSGGETQSVTGSGSGGTETSARTTPLSDAGLDHPHPKEALKATNDDVLEKEGAKEKEKAKATDKDRDFLQSHPHHPGTITMPPPPRWHPPHMPAHTPSHGHPHPHPGYPYPGYPIPSPSAYPLPHNPAQMTPHGLPPITPSMPPFTFYNPVGSPMPSPALAYPVSPYAMAGGTPLHSPGIPGYHPMGMMMVTPTGIMPPPPPSVPQPPPQSHVPQPEQERPGTARRPRKGSGLSVSEDAGPADDEAEKNKSTPDKGKAKVDDNPYFSFASVAASQQSASPAPAPAPPPQQSPMHPMPPPFPHPMHMGMYHPMHPMTPFSPGLAMSPWEPNPYINAAVGAPVHHSHPAAPYYAGATPSSVGVELGSGGGNVEAGIGGYFDSVYRQESGSGSVGSGGNVESPNTDRGTPREDAVAARSRAPQEYQQKRSSSYNLNLPSFDNRGDKPTAEMTRTQSMSSHAASRPMMHRPDSDPGDRQHGQVVVSPEEDNGKS